MAELDHDTYCSHIVDETDRLREALRGADLSTTVPTCPEWDLRELATHLSGAHRLAEEVVRTRALEYDIKEAIARREQAPEDPAELDRWLGEGAEALAKALRAAGPDVEVWSWSPVQRTSFYARRMALETLIHRADAFLTVGRPYQADGELAADAVDELLQLLTWPQALAFRPKLAELRGAGETIHLHATDTPAELAAEWLIERQPDGVAWRREHGKGDVALRGPLTEVLLAFYRRLPLDDERLEVLGDQALLEHWLQLTAL
ncbi:maleylpyruvate isomerase family mycothiol-dependent enzyme [Streptomyces sp. RPT161]|uniref:maleylpyruvate isomerase family mycothiol-dependent enzyme n=1 Tax=Streptomyces sp. RPT161 TaxID=3015993 RepID=UPI0022B8660B|nr:maleylpyruvate isomerase family mycothiol-dependent enzyme [Streptomyces sp. RPT161]